MLLLAKIGTLSTQVVRTKWLRVLPCIDEVFWVHEHLDTRTRKPLPGTKPIQVICRGIVGRPGSDALYLLERF